MGRVLEYQGNFIAALAAYLAAIERDPSQVVWRNARAKLNETQKEWAAAADDFRTLVAAEPDRRKWRMSLAQSYEKSPDPRRAIAVYTEVRDRFGADAGLLRRLAAAHEAAGEWSAACRVLREVLVTDPHDIEAEYRLAKCLEKLARVPFELRDGEVVTNTAELRGDDDLLGRAPDELVTIAAERFVSSLTRQPRRVTPVHRLAARLARRKRLYRVAMRVPGLAGRVHRRFTRPETRIRRHHELGRMYERHHQWAEAATAYRTAIAGLQQVDSVWVHRAEPEWRFRLDYVEQRHAPSEHAEVRLHRTVAVAVDSVPETPNPDPGGFFDAVMLNTGLRVEGFLVPNSAESIDIYVGDTLVKQVAANPGSWLRSFSFEITHRALTDFPPQARLTVRAGERRLVTSLGAAEVEVSVPGGSGRLAELLSTGHSLNKKGVLARPASEVGDRQLRYLKSYIEAKERFEAVLGKKLFLLYGTLLGCHRDGAFIAGDDDFDVAYLSDAADPVELKQELQHSALALLAAGYDVAITVTGRLFKIRSNETWLDVNPLWFFQDRAWAFDTHNLTRADFEPIQTTEFLGHDVYVPNQIEAFLEDNYGADWRIPQPDFRYYRNEADRRVLRRSWLTPSEAREFARLAEEVRRTTPSAGRYVGIGDPADTGFSA